MSDELKQRPHAKWLNLPSAVCVIAMMGAYQGAHYATAAISDPDPVVFCVGYCTHKIGGTQVPEWVDEYFFWPARKLDDMLGINPWGWH
jgi:hypothetical protein